MKDEAVRAGDQPFGAVIVKDGTILGFGPSRVVLKKDSTAHAEREAIREVQARLGRSDLAGRHPLLQIASVRRVRSGDGRGQCCPHDPRRRSHRRRLSETLMIDHVSIGVRYLAACGRFYEAVLAAIGYTRLVVRPGTIGFGKKYPDFWLNERGAMPPSDPDSGTHFCLRAPSVEAVQAFHAATMAGGGTSDGAPGSRPEYTAGYYAAFVRVPEGNKVEAVTFTAGRG